jgi:GNAT superfamily N-acetyltransferase
VAHRHVGALRDVSIGGFVEQKVRPLEEADRPWVRECVIENWAGEIVVIRGKVHRPHDLPGDIIEADGDRVGMAIYHVAADECEIVALLATQRYRGIGTALVKAVRDRAMERGCRRVWLITTNDNLDALRFYQRRGFELVAVHRRALDISRRIKPSIPLIGEYGIPLRDEIELEMPLIREDR